MAAVSEDQNGDDVSRRDGFNREVITLPIGPLPNNKPRLALDLGQFILGGPKARLMSAVSALYVLRCYHQSSTYVMLSALYVQTESSRLCPHAIV